MQWKAKYCIIKTVYNRGRIVLFGYVTFYKDELKIKDYNKFKAYYCGLCKELGKRFNQLVRLGLSYDFTFLALLLDSVDENETVFSQEGCFKHFGKKRPTVKNNSHIQYAADMSVLFMYFKLLDDIKTGQKIKNVSTFIQNDESITEIGNVDFHTMVVLEWSNKTQEFMRRNVLVDKEKPMPALKNGDIITYVTHSNVLLSYGLKSDDDVFEELEVKE